MVILVGFGQKVPNLIPICDRWLGLCTKLARVNTRNLAPSRRTATGALLAGLLVTSIFTAPAAAASASEMAETPSFTGFLARRSSTAPARTGAASRAGERTDLDYAPVSIVVDAEYGTTTQQVYGELVANAVTVPGERGGATRMEVRTVTDPHVRVERQDANRFSDLPPAVVQAGRDGEITRVYRYTDDGEAAGVPVLEIVISERQDEIVAIGTRERPVATPAVFDGDSVTGGIPESVWVALAQCESGGRPSVISAGGRFHGLYQFSVATWRSVGGEGLPSQASPQEQRYRAVRLQARSGWGQWPSCSRRIGVR